MKFKLVQIKIKLMQMKLKENFDEVETEAAIRYSQSHILVQCTT